MKCGVDVLVLVGDVKVFAFLGNAGQRFVGNAVLSALQCNKKALYEYDFILFILIYYLY